MLAGRFTSAAFAITRLRLAQWVAGVAFTLANATAARLAKGKAGQVNLGDRNTDQILALASDHLAVGNILA